MSKIYEVVVTARGANKLYIGAESAEEAVGIAEKLYCTEKEIELKNQLEVMIDAVSINDNEAYSKVLGEEEEEVRLEDMCKNCGFLEMFIEAMKDEKESRDEGNKEKYEEEVREGD